MKQSDRERINQLIRDEYPIGDLNALAKKCGCSMNALKQRACKLKVNRDKKTLRATISASRIKAYAQQRNIQKYADPNKPSEIIDVFKLQATLLSSIGYQALASIPEFIAIECQNVKQLSKLPYLKRHIQKM